MRDWLSRLSWPSVVVVGLALAAIVGVVALLPADARTEVILGLLALAGGAAGVAGAMPSAVRPSRPPPSASASQEITRPVRVSSVPPRPRDGGQR